MANVFYRDFTPASNFTKPDKPTYRECMGYFIQFLENFSVFTDKDFQGLEDYWEYVLLHKNDAIVLPGEVCNQIVFVCKGSIKHFTGGMESPYIIEFVTDCNFSCGLRSFKDQLKTMDGYVCAKNTYGLKISYANYQKLIKEKPAFETLFNLMSEKAMYTLVSRLASFQSLDAKGRYELMLSQHPDVFEKFTMQDISNYLGIKAETLSRLKKGIERQ